MASWMKYGKDFDALLAEAAQIDPDIAAALDLKNTVPFGSGLDLARAVSDLCLQEQYDAEGEPVYQSIEISLNFITWTRKGKPSRHQGRRIYGSWEPGFYLRIGQKSEDVARGPKEWTPNRPMLVYNFMLTVSSEKGKREMKQRAEDLDWELVSG